jgi:Tfp pilus assembly protein PilO
MKNHIKNLFLLLFIIALTYSALALLVVTPTVTSIADNQTKLAESYAKISDLENTQKELERWKKNESVLDVMVGNADHLWPAESSIDTFTTKVRKTAVNNGVNVTKFSFGMPKDGTATYELEGTSSYSNIFQFVDGLGKIDRFSTIPLVEMTSPDGSLINLKISGQIFYGN